MGNSSQSGGRIQAVWRKLFCGGKGAVRAEKAVGGALPGRSRCGSLVRKAEIWHLQLDAKASTVTKGTVLVSKIHCAGCGAKVGWVATRCPACGTTRRKPEREPDTSAPTVSNKSFSITLLLCLFVGFMGVHRFYVGKFKTGIFQLLTCGGFFIWTAIDFIVIFMEEFRDANNRKITW